MRNMNNMRQAQIININLREIVLDLLLENEKNPGHSHVLIRQMLDKYSYLSKTQRSFIKRLSEGTIERQIEEDWIINSVSKTGTDKMKPVIRNVLRMSVYQMKYMDNVPKPAVCNEAVKLAVKRKFGPLKGFVNGVMRNLSKNIDTIGYPAKDKDFILYYSIKYSMPEFLVRHFINECGIENVEKVFDGFDADRKLYICANTRLVKAEQLKKILQEEGVCVRDTHVPYAFEISGYDNPAELASFKDGLFQIQDLSSILAGLAVNPACGSTIIDVCAAPGGKCIHAAQRADKVTIEARDISDAKIEMIKSNIERMKAVQIHTKVWDAAVFDEDAEETADMLICDVPCSGLGILGRKADIRYNVTRDKIKDLVKLQRQILAASYRYVKPGGYLIYSTCTINREENLDNILWFTKEFPFETDSIVEDYPMLDKDTRSEGYVQLLPGIDGTDGFFIARLKRVDNGTD